MQPPGNSSASNNSDDPALPGIPSGDGALMKTLTNARLAKGSDYKPRTHHMLKGGVPKFTNRLILETSPYLLQHAHNPVNWRAWGDEAFARAKKENRPVLLSIGYSTCHWCHVMERESFEDLEIAAYINRNYVAIKVDREERPDIDDIYMSAVQLMSGRGGWPMTVVLTPDREPFFGATYIPARDGDRGSRTGFYTILQELRGRFDSERDTVVAEAQQLSARIRQNATPARPGAVAGPPALVRAAHTLAMTHDPVWGGFGNAPKFPRPATLDMLLRYHRRTKDPQALSMVVQTLKKMAAGGMYDHVGGGFHRYSTDNVWLVPHFEKMLYDNAQLTVTYLEAYQVTREQDFAQVAREVLRYVTREMTKETHGFYSATDADSPTPGGHEEEGYFFTWTPQEVLDVVGNGAARSVNEYYGVTPQGNFESRTIFNTPRPLSVVAKELRKTADALRAELEEAKTKLYEVRKKRPPPGLDDKILTSWNGLMISAFAKGGLILGEPSYTQTAVRAATFVLATMRDENGRLRRSFKDGRARHMGFLDDYAFLIQGLLDVYESTFDAKWLKAAKKLQEILDKHYWDEVGGGYFMTADDQEKLLARDKPSYDGAEPSGNSVAALNLLRFEEFTTEHVYRQRAEKLFSAFAEQLTQRPTGVPKMVVALDYYLDTPLEILIIAPEGGDADELLAKVRSTFLPNRILTVATGPREVAEQASVIPLMESKLALGGKATAFVCEKSRCELPTSDANVLAKQLAKIQPLMENLAPLPVRDPASEPKAWQYDASTNKHWHPGHGHWHDGRPPAGR